MSERGRRLHGVLRQSVLEHSLSMLGKRAR
jgi:hypothetical protein